MIKICVALHEGQGQYNEHMVHSHVRGVQTATLLFTFTLQKYIYPSIIKRMRNVIILSILRE